MFARRLESSNGKFAGIIFASVSTKYFEDIYGSVQSFTSLLFTLLKSDGTILVRYPQGQELAGNKLSAEADRLDAWSKNGGAFLVLAKTDQNLRFVSVRAVPEYGLFVSISVTERAALASWRSRATLIGFGSAVLLICSICFLVAGMRQVQRLSQSKALLAQRSHQLTYMARHDDLTALANRALFLDRVNELLVLVRERGAHFSILLLDLDRFKNINDSLGHFVGDTLLKAIAERLRRVVPGVDNVARLGGDEFAIVHEGESAHNNGAILLASRISAAVTEPYDLDGQRVTIGISIGIASAPRDGANADALINNADRALYAAKFEGGNRYRLFEASMEVEARERRELEEDLRNAIANNEFEIHYQTVVDVGMQACCGAEALIRWRHPHRGMVYPDQFIALAEDSGLIIALGEWILRRACADAVKWPSHLKLAVNLSPAQFERGDLLSILKSTLADSGLPADRLKLEITETVLLESTERVHALFHEIKNLGVSIVLDDFGIGYCSMRYLQMFPIDEIKIDKSFIQSMVEDTDSAAIVSAIASLGRTLDIETTAEGVETIEQLLFVRGAGCRFAQGYLFSRPVPASALTFEHQEAPQQGEEATPAFTARRAVH